MKKISIILAFFVFAIGCSSYQNITHDYTYNTFENMYSVDGEIYLESRQVQVTENYYVKTSNLEGDHVDSSNARFISSSESVLSTIIYHCVRNVSELECDELTIIFN